MKPPVDVRYIQGIQIANPIPRIRTSMGMAGGSLARKLCPCYGGATTGGPMTQLRWDLAGSSSCHGCSQSLLARQQMGLSLSHQDIGTVG